MKQGTCETPVEENSFWAKWLSLQKILFKRCMKITEQYHDAQDLLSELMYKAFLKGPSSEKSLKHFENWLSKLAKNIAIDIRRHNEKLIHTEDVEILLMDQSLQLSRSPRQEMIYEEQLFAVNSIIKDFSPNYRHLIQNFFVDDYSYEDLTSTYSLNIDYIRKIVSLARKKISVFLDSYESGQWNIITLPEPESVLEGDNIHEHSFMIGTPHHFHFGTIFTDVIPGRLEQKEKSYRDYLDKTPNSGLKRLLLAKNLLSQGKLSEAEKQLDILLEANYNDNEVFEYKILLSKLSENHAELKSLASLAVSKIPNPPAIIEAVNKQYNISCQNALDFYRVHLSNNPEDINSRVEYIKLLDEMENYQEAFNEYINLESLSPNNLKILPYAINYKLVYEENLSAAQYAQNSFNNHQNSICAAIFHLHFLIKDYKTCKSDHNIQLILNRLRKKYAWHPDFALLKALLIMKSEGNANKKSKTLIRRCADYPGCGLSKYYLKIFGKHKVSELPKLLPSTKHHLRIVNAIHQTGYSSDKEKLYALK